MAYSTLLYDKADAVGTITLNRPDKSNAFDDTLIGLAKAVALNSVNVPPPIVVPPV